MISSNRHIQKERDGMEGKKKKTRHKPLQHEFRQDKLKHKTAKRTMFSLWHRSMGLIKSDSRSENMIT